MYYIYFLMLFLIIISISLTSSLHLWFSLTIINGLCDSKLVFYCCCFIVRVELTSQGGSIVYHINIQKAKYCILVSNVRSLSSKRIKACTTCTNCNKYLTFRIVIVVVIIIIIIIIIDIIFCDYGILWIIIVI